MVEEKVEKEKQEVLTEGFIFSDGKFLSSVEVAKLWKQSVLKSVQLDPGVEEGWSGVDAVAPPYKFSNLVKMLEVNTEHFRCCRAKAVDTAGLGWSIQPDSTYKGRPKEGDKTKLNNFFSNVNPKEEFIEILDRVLLDFESTGNGMVEVSRNRVGEPKYLYHIPVTSIRVRKGRTGFLQTVLNNKIYLQNWGDKFPDAGKQQGVRGKPHFIDKNDGKSKGGLRWNSEKTTNEVLHLLNYHPSSSYYGLPDFLPAVGAMAGNVSARDFNLDFFDNRGIPAYAIVIKGARLDPELRTLIQTFFESKLKGSPHRTLILPVPNKNVEVHFEKLALDTREGSFSKYTHDNRDEVIRAHGVVPARIGIISTASLGGGSGYSQAETYKNAIVEPRQRRLEFLLNHRIIQEGFQIYGWVMKFADLDIRDRSAQVANAAKLIDRGVVSVDWVRQNVLKEDATPGGNRPFVKLGRRIIFIDDLEKGTEEPSREPREEED